MFTSRIARSSFSAAANTCSSPTLPATPFTVWTIRSASLRVLALQCGQDLSNPQSACLAANCTSKSRYSRLFPSYALQAAYLVNSSDIRKEHVLGLLLQICRALSVAETPRGFTQRINVANNTSGSMGLLTWSFIPASRQRCLSSTNACAVMAMIGSESEAQASPAEVW